MVPALRNNGSMIPATAQPVNRLATVFDRFFNDDFFAPLTATRAWSPLAWWEDDHNYYVEMDAPGVTDKDVEVAVHQGELTIKGERKCERKGDGYDSRCYGQFEQRIKLAAPVDADKVEARLANGVLSVTLPKSESARPRRITLKTE